MLLLRRAAAPLVLLLALLGTAAAAEPRTVIYDLDDTLIGTQQLYERATDQFVALAKTRGIDGRRARAVFERTDLAYAKTFGLSKKRLPTAMHDAMVELTGDAKAGRQAARIARHVFVSRERNYPNARAVLQDHQAAGDRVIILTKGVRSLQQARIARSGLAGLFDHVEIVPDKSAASYTKLLKKFNLDPKRTFVIGNSFKSDIATAHAAGIPGTNTIWLSQRVMWKNELLGIPKSARQTTLRATSLRAAQRLMR